MRKKNYLLVAMMLIVAMLVTACGGGGAKTGGDTKSDKVTISFIHWRGEDTEAFNEIIKKFETEYPNIKVEMSAFPSREYEATLTTKLRGGNSGDVFAVFPGAAFAAVREADLIKDITGESFVDRFYPNLILAGQDGGKQFGLPFQLVYNQPIYNKGMFEKFGLEVPRDWEGFLALCEALKQNGVEYPIVFPAADNGPGQFMNSMMMNNEPDEDIWRKVQAGERKITEDWWVKTLSQFKELNDRGFFGREPLGITQSVSGTIFAQERAGMLAMGSYMMAQAVEQNPNLQIGLLAPITVSESEMVWEGIHTTTFLLGVNNQSRHQEEAKKFIEFLTRPENASIYTNKTGQWLTLKDVTYTSRVLQDNAHWLEKNTRFQPRFTLTNPQVQEAVLSSIEDVLGGTSPEAAAAKAQQIIDQAIRK